MLRSNLPPTAPLYFSACMARVRQAVAVAQAKQRSGEAVEGGLHARCVQGG